MVVRHLGLLLDSRGFNRLWQRLLWRREPFWDGGQLDGGKLFFGKGAEAPEPDPTDRNLDVVGDEILEGRPTDLRETARSLGLSTPFFSGSPVFV